MLVTNYYTIFIAKSALKNQYRIRNFMHFCSIQSNIKKTLILTINLFIYILKIQKHIILFFINFPLGQRFLNHGSQPKCESVRFYEWVANTSTVLSTLVVFDL